MCESALVAYTNIQGPDCRRVVSDLGLHCLLCPVCPNISSKYDLRLMQTVLVLQWTFQFILFYEAI